jgi:hypothetical protein
MSQSLPLEAVRQRLTPESFLLNEKTISAATVTCVDRPSSATSPVGPLRLGGPDLAARVELERQLIRKESESNAALLTFGG